MKTAVSILDDVFEAAQRLARRTNGSRSDIYSAAVREYITRHTGEVVTEAMNSVIDQVGGTGIDPFCFACSPQDTGTRWMVISHVEISWADLPPQTGSGHCFCRPVVVSIGAGSAQLLVLRDRSSD